MLHHFLFLIISSDCKSLSSLDSPAQGNLSAPIISNSSPHNDTDPAHLHLAKQRLHRPLRILARILDHPSNLLESTQTSASPSTNTPQERNSLSNLRIPHTLIQPTLTRRNHCPRLPQPRQRNRNLLRITATHPIRKDIHLMPRRERINCCLRDADVAFDAHDDYLGGGAGGEVVR